MSRLRVTVSLLQSGQLTLVAALWPLKVNCEYFFLLSKVWQRCVFSHKGCLTLGHSLGYFMVIVCILWNTGCWHYWMVEWILKSLLYILIKLETVLEARNPKLVSLGWNQGVDRAVLLLKGQGESTLASCSSQLSCAGGHIPTFQATISKPVSVSLRVSFPSMYVSCLLLAPSHHTCYGM